MSHLYYFNPGNDAALASGLERFTPPHAARLMARAGELLPLWWAEPGDHILASPESFSTAEALKEQFGLHGEIGATAGLDGAPWGWSRDARRLLADSGCRVPTVEYVDTLRTLSHRRTSLSVLQLLGVDEALLPVVATTADDAWKAINRFGRAVLKQPWSCSGRGVFFSHRLAKSSLSQLIEGCLRRQGSILVEPYYEATAEMAALFHADDSGHVALRGFSCFNSGPSGAYLGNMVAPQTCIREKCGEEAVKTAQRLQGCLEHVLDGHYRGWLGVDMLRSGVSVVCPCMEVNLRMTMGIVAMFMAEKGLSGTLLTTDTLRPGDLRLSPPEATLQIVVRSCEEADKDDARAIP